MFDDRLYKRGALLVHALRLTLGDDTFFTMLREWTSRHALGSVSTADFIQHATEFGGPSIAPLINEWLFNLALPALPSSATPR
jgi:aminopeptidase N